MNSLKRSRVDSNLTADDFSNCFASVMTDSQDNLTQMQSEVVNYVRNKANALMESVSSEVNITVSQVYDSIKALNTGVAAGNDGVTTEHLVHGLSDDLCTVLADLFSVMLTYGIVPAIFKLGIIVPIIKKSTLDANSVESYRPVTLSSVFSKLLELIIHPSHSVNSSQFGYQKGRGTTFAVSLINDVSSVFVDRGSPVYLCTLDAEKCFDSIWHMGLLFKLSKILPERQWLFLYNWYNMSYAAVRWNSQTSRNFKITKGMRQGSVLSPTLFNIFMDDMMCKLEGCECGLRIADMKFNSCAYADDVTLFSSTATGLQNLIDLCVSYSKMWRFSYGIKKTKAMIIGKQLLSAIPVWTLDGAGIKTCENIELLGVTLNNQGLNNLHVSNRISASRKSLYRLSSFSGLSADVKSYLWKAVGAPALTYGMECLSLAKVDIDKLVKFQCTFIKDIFDLPRRSHHSNLLVALDVPRVENVIVKNTVMFYRRIFSLDSPLRHLHIYLLSQYISDRKLYRGTVIQRVCDAGVSPVGVALGMNFKCRVSRGCPDADQGIVDSLRYLLHRDGHERPGSCEHSLVRLLTCAF